MNGFWLPLALDQRQVAQLEARPFHGTPSRIRRSFQSDAEANAIFKHILAVSGLTGMEDRITIRATAGTEAFVEKDERLIFYNAEFMQGIARKDKNYWSMVAVLAHEVGHHIRFHTVIQGHDHKFELEADYQHPSAIFCHPVAAATHVSRMKSLSIRRTASVHKGCARMRRFVVGIGFLASTLLSAAPADAYEAPFGWTGLYVGVNAGYSWGRATADVSVSGTVNAVPFDASGSRSGDVNGWLGGGQIGYNWRSQRWVYGVEADFQWTGQDGDVSACAGQACAKASYELDWFGTLRGRVGYLLEPRSLLYVTGGLAYGHVSADFSVSHPLIGTFSVSDSATRVGWVIGGGWEWAYDRNWMLRAEYLYMDLGSMRTKLGPVATTIPNGEFPIDVSASGTVRTDFTDHIFRLALSYQFNEAYAPLK